MANVRISDLQAVAAQGGLVVAASSADGTSTGKVALSAIAALASQNGAVISDTDIAGGGSTVTNIVVITEEDYTNLPEDSIHPTTVYIIV